MATVNPKTLRWTHDGRRVDGTDIGYALAYEVGMREKDTGAPYEVVYSMPATLNPDGNYSLGQDAPGATLPELFPIPPGKMMEISVRARDLGVLSGDPADDELSEWATAPAEVIMYAPISPPASVTAT